MELKQEQLIQIKVLKRKHFDQIPDMPYIPENAKVIGVVKIGQVEYALFTTAEGQLGSTRWVSHASHHINTSRGNTFAVSVTEVRKEWDGFEQLFLD